MKGKGVLADGSPQKRLLEELRGARFVLDLGTVRPLCLTCGPGLCFRAVRGRGVLHQLCGDRIRPLGFGTT